MVLDPYIASALPEPTGGIAMLILIIYALIFLLQKLIGERLPNEGEISSIALSLTAFVLSLYMLIAAWNSSSDSIYALGITKALNGFFSSEGVPLIISIGIYTSPLIALLTTLFSLIHLLMMVGISVQLQDRDYFAQIMAYCALFILAVMVVILSPDLPFIFLGLFIGNKALNLLANIFYEDKSSSIDSILERLTNFAVVVVICVLFIKYRVWHEDIFRNISIHFSLGAIDLKLGETTSLTRQIYPIGFGLLLFALIIALFIKSWLKATRLFQHISNSRPGNTLLWGYATVWGSIGILLLLRWGQYLPESLKTIVILLGCLICLRALWGILNTWQIHQLFMMCLLLNAGYIFVLVGLGQQTLSFLMIVSLIIAGTLIFSISSILIAPLYELLQKHGLKVYHPKEKISEMISSGDIRYMRGLRKKAPRIFWVYAFSLAVMIGMPLTLKYHVLMEVFNFLFQHEGIASKLLLTFILLTSLVSFWGIGRHFGLLASGESIISRIQRPKNSKRDILGVVREEPLYVFRLDWRVWTVIVFLGLMNLFWGFSINPLTIEGSWVWELFLEKNNPPLYGLHFIWLLIGTIIFIIAANKYRNKSIINLMKE